jgi:hypothetical protein
MAGPHLKKKVSIQDHPVFKSLEVIAKKTGLSHAQLLPYTATFSAQPSQCGCGHEWHSIFTLKP